MKKRIALIPAYKPNIQLLEFVKGIEEHGMDCLIVNDGSGEAYLSLFHKIERETEARVLSFPENRGKGAALKAGLKSLQKENVGLQGDFTIITLDADGQNLLKDALNLLSVAEEKKDTLILGSRTQSKDSPLRSRIGNGITKEVFNLCTGVEVKDTQTGMRAFSGKMIPKMLTIPGERYEYEMNVLLFLAKEGVPMEELPIETVYINDNAESHFDTVKDSYRIYKQILKFSASSLLSFLADFLLYSFFFLITGGLFVSNFMARVISLHLNFFLNKTMVFSKDGEKEDIEESKKRIQNRKYLRKEETGNINNRKNASNKALISNKKRDFLKNDITLDEKNKLKRVIKKQESYKEKREKLNKETKDKSIRNTNNKRKNNYISKSENKNKIKVENKNKNEKREFVEKRKFKNRENIKKRNNKIKKKSVTKK